MSYPYIAEDLHGLVVPIDSVTFDPESTRKHPDRNIEAIKASLERFGQQKPIVCDPEGRVIAGNGALQAAKILGWTHIAVQNSTLIGDEARAFAIADNRTSDLSEKDPDALAAALATLDPAQAFAAGFNLDELAATLSADALALVKSRESSSPPVDEDAEAASEFEGIGSEGDDSDGASAPNQGYATIILTSEKAKVDYVRSGLNELKREWGLETLMEVVERLIEERQGGDHEALEE
jgi:hypothetical protein